MRVYFLLPSEFDPSQNINSDSLSCDDDLCVITTSFANASGISHLFCVVYRYVYLCLAACVLLKRLLCRKSRDRKIKNKIKSHPRKSSLAYRIRWGLIKRSNIFIQNRIINVHYYLRVGPFSEFIFIYLLIF